MKFRCNKCGSLNMETEKKGSQVGLYCCDCGKWYKWLTKEEERVFNSNNKIEINRNKDKCIVIESDIASEFEECLGNCLNDGYKIECSSCNSGLYKAVLILDE